MPFKTVQMFAGYIPELQANERLQAATVASIPHMEQKARKQLYNMWFYEAGLDPKEFDASPRIPWDKVREFIGAPKKGTSPTMTREGRTREDKKK